MTLFDDINRYIRTKNSKKYYDTVKRDFFTKIIELSNSDNLTIDTLICELKNLSRNERNELFYRQRSLGPSVDSHAAQLTRRLFLSLGIDLDTAALATIVSHGISDDNERLLKKRPYITWFKSPYAEKNIQHLNHQLTINPPLDSPATTPIDLVATIKKVFSDAPAYLSQWINTCYNQPENTPENRKIQAEQLINIHIEPPIPELVLASANLEIACSFVQNKPEIFYGLSQSMQTQVLECFSKNDQTVYHNIITRLDNISPAQATGFLEQKQHLHLSHITLQAINLIDDYLLLSPNRYKREFFENLKRKLIKDDKLTVTLLKTELALTDPALLFANMLGKNNARATKLIASLYRLATDTVLTRAEKTKLCSNNVLPTPFDQNISAFASTKTLVRHHKNHINRAGCEAIYQTFLINKGLERLSADRENMVIDLQGHALIELTLTAREQQALLNELNDNYPVFANGNQPTLEHYLGHKPTATTWCKLDLTNLDDKTLIESFRAKFASLDSELTAAIDALIESNSRNSIIAFQEEISMHILLSLRVLEKAFKLQPLDPGERKALMLELNQLMLKKVKPLLRTDIKNGMLQIKTLNQQLDDLRKPSEKSLNGIKKLSLIDECRDILKKHVTTKNRNVNFNDKAIFNSLTSKLCESTTATGFDYLRTDSVNQLSVRITGTDHTAHAKALDTKNLALRVNLYNHYAANPVQVTPLNHITMGARIPSLTVINSDATDKELTRDNCDKLAECVKTFNPNLPKHYFLLTSLHTKLYDCSFIERKNQQQKAAEFILKGAHRYNQDQINNLNPNPNNFIYVQNIPVNQHTHKLRDYALGKVTPEATLMADVSLMTLFDYYSALFPPALAHDIHVTYQRTHHAYRRFLSDEFNQTNDYFADSSRGDDVIRFLKSKKQHWQQAIKALPPAKSFNELVMRTLFCMSINNAHHDPQFGMLMQSLSLSIAPASLTGCKSANERYQGVAGRAELLKSLTMGKNLTPDQVILRDRLETAFKMYLASFGSDRLTTIQTTLDSAYNKYNLQAASAAISLEDQGGASKIISSDRSDGIIDDFSTNCAETGLTNLSQNNTSRWQVHKAKLPKILTKLFLGDLPKVSKNQYSIFSKITNHFWQDQHHQDDNRGPVNTEICQSNR